MCCENSSTLRNQSLELNLESLCCVHANFGPPTRMSARNGTSACKAPFHRAALVVANSPIGRHAIVDQPIVPRRTERTPTAIRSRPSLALRAVLDEAGHREGRGYCGRVILKVFVSTASRPHRRSGRRERPPLFNYRRLSSSACPCVASDRLGASKPTRTALSRHSGTSDAWTVTNPTNRQTAALESSDSSRSASAVPAAP